MVVTKIKILFLLLSLLAVNTFAQEFNASADKTTVNQNERFQVYFTFQNGDINKISNFKPPAFKGLKVLSGPNESRSMQIINGQVSGSLTYSFVVVATDVGKAEIGGGSLVYNGTALLTDPLSINVVKGSSTNQQVDKQLGISQQELDNNVFIRAIPNKNRIKQGEQLTVTYKLYTKLNISSPQISKLPTFNGFWSEDLETSNNIQFEIEMYNGERYRSATIKKVALFPTKSGELTLTPFELKVPVIVKSKRGRNDIFDDFFNDSFFGRTETIEHIAKSNRLNITVEPLPSANVPNSFSGAVGKFDFTVALDKNEVQLNEAITVKTRISGTGNISLIKLPEIKFPVGFEKYEPKTNESINRKNVISGRKDIEFLIVPRIPGIKEIPPLEFTYFDLAKNEYVTLQSQPFTVTVKEGEGSYAQSTTGYTKEDVKLLNEDIRFIKTSTSSFVKKEEIAKISALFWVGLILPLGILLSLIIFNNKQNKLAGNVSLLRYQKAAKNAKLKLKDASKSLESNDLAGYYNNLSAALFNYLGEKLGILPADFTLDRAIEKLKIKNVDENFIANVKKVSEKCEFARFAPNAVGSDSEGIMFKSIEEIIDNLESSITGKK
ncbi:MAG: protein BatD [Ignavibacteriales bacterium]|nr:protein BatD [Ignavibacteriales bacterium]